MSRPKINPALAALDAEIANARQHLQAIEGDAERARQLADALVAARGRMETAGATSARAARGSIERAIGKTLGAGPGQVYTAEQIRLATGQNPASVRKALARMVEAKALLLDGDHYSLPAVAEAAQ